MQKGRNSQIYNQEKFERPLAAAKHSAVQHASGLDPQVMVSGLSLPPSIENPPNRKCVFHLECSFFCWCKRKNERKHLEERLMNNSSEKHYVFVALKGTLAADS